VISAVGVASCGYGHRGCQVCSSVQNINTRELLDVGLVPMGLDIGDNASGQTCWFKYSKKSIDHVTWSK